MVCVIKEPAIVRLCWADIAAIADALAFALPGLSANSIDLEDIRRYVVALPGFDDTAENADRTCLLQIREAWHTRTC